MRLLTIHAPEGHGAVIAQMALDMGLLSASVSQVWKLRGRQLETMRTLLRNEKGCRGFLFPQAALLLFGEYLYFQQKLRTFSSNEAWNFSSFRCSS